VTFKLGGFKSKEKKGCEKPFGKTFHAELSNLKKKEGEVVVI